MKQTATNQFQDGLNYDLHPIVTPNSVLTDNINGTLITYNGNEFCLQNDRGNNKTYGHLNTGYIPLGIKEHNGVLYIVSYNQSTGKGQVGTFPGINWNSNYEQWIDFSQNPTYSPIKVYSGENDEYYISNLAQFADNIIGSSLPLRTKLRIWSDLCPSEEMSIEEQWSKIYLSPIIGERLDKISFSTEEERDNAYDILDDLFWNNPDLTPIPLTLGQSFRAIKHNEREVKSLENLDLEDFNFDLNHPITIEIQDSYDGSVNLIITDNKNPIRIINSGFSVSGNQYKLIKRNNYDTITINEFDSVSKLIKKPVSFANFVDVEVSANGELKGGNYTLYARFGDNDGNKTDVLAESSIISIFKGTIGKPNTISGTLSDERTDKSIKITLNNIPVGYTKVYISYVREFSDTQGYLMKEAYDLSEPFDVNSDKACEIIISGIENLTSIGIEDLNIKYYSAETARTIAQQQDMLFLGNVKKTTIDYQNFDAFAKLIVTHLTKLKPLEDQNISYLETQKNNSSYFDDISIVTPEYSVDGEYYNINNIYSKVGYWPGEYYRFGIVFILKDGSETDAFNMNGGYIKVGSYLPIENQTEEEIQYNNDKGVFKTEFGNKSFIIDNNTVTPLHFVFDCQTMVEAIKQSEYSDTIAGYFFVRQKRIPEEITQGIQLPMHRLLHVPAVRWNNGNFVIQKFITSDNRMIYSPTTADGDIVTIPSSDPYYIAIPIYLNYLYAPYSWHSWTKYLVVEYSASGNINVSNITLQSTKPNNAELDSSLKATFYFNTDNGDNRKGNYGNRNPWKTSKPNNVGISYLTTTQVERVADELNSYNTDNRTWFNDVAPRTYTKIDTSTGGATNFSYITVSNPEENCSAMLSLEAILDKNIQNKLNGSNFDSDLLYSESTKIKGLHTSAWNGIQDDNGWFKNWSNQESCKAVYINSNNPGKVLDGNVYRTVIGNAYSVENGFEPAIASITSAERDKVVRGIFCPYIGLTLKYPNDNAEYNNQRPYIYKYAFLQLSNRTEVNLALSLRGNDNSPYYTVSDRYSIDTNTVHVYRGDCYTTTNTIRILTNFIDPNYPYTEKIIDENGWTNYLPGGGQDPDYSQINISDLNTISLGYWLTFKTLTSSNIGLRAEDPFDTQAMALFGNPRSFYPLNATTATAGKQADSELFNAGYGITTGEIRKQGYTEKPYDKQEYSNRIMFSNKDVKNSFSNGYRVFQALSYNDYDKQYGEIVKLVPWGNNLFCVFEHGLAILPINEKALLQTTTEQTIHIYGHGVLPDTMSIVSQDYGSQYEHSVIRTPLGIYGIDVDAKKIWRFTDKQGFETISDMKIETFLEDSLRPLYNIELPDIDVRTHYNAFKGDVIFTWYNKKQGTQQNPNNDYHQKSICYNERKSLWITQYDWVPIVSENINGDFYTLQKSETANTNTVHVYSHDVEKSDPTKWFDGQHKFEFEFVVSDPIGVHKIFDNLQIISNNVQPEEMEISIIGDDYMFKRDEITPETVELIRREYDDISSTTSNIHDENGNKTYKPNVSVFYKWDKRLKQKLLVKWQPFKDIYKFGRRIGNIQYRGGMWYTQIEPLLVPRGLDTDMSSTNRKEARIRDKWAKIRIRYSGKDLAVITAIKTLINI